MKILYELSWLWETLGIALVAAAICMACAALICKAAKKKLGKKVLAVIGTAAFVGAILSVILIARTPVPLLKRRIGLGMIEGIYPICPRGRDH